MCGKLARWHNLTCGLEGQSGATYGDCTGVDIHAINAAIGDFAQCRSVMGWVGLLRAAHGCEGIGQSACGGEQEVATATRRIEDGEAEQRTFGVGSAGRGFDGRLQRAVEEAGNDVGRCVKRAGFLTFDGVAGQVAFVGGAQGFGGGGRVAIRLDVGFDARFDAGFHAGSPAGCQAIGA